MAQCFLPERVRSIRGDCFHRVISVEKYSLECRSTIILMTARTRLNNNNNIWHVSFFPKMLLCSFEVSGNPVKQYPGALHPAPPRTPPSSPAAENPPAASPGSPSVCGPYAKQCGSYTHASSPENRVGPVAETATAPSPFSCASGIGQAAWAKITSLIVGLDIQQQTTQYWYYCSVPTFCTACTFFYAAFGGRLEQRWSSPSFCPFCFVSCIFTTVSPVTRDPSWEFTHSGWSIMPLSTCCDKGTDPWVWF